jgi:hypothetical protein
MAKSFFLALFCALASLSAQAQVFAGYDSFCGVPVIVQSTKQIAVAALDNNGIRIIIIDPGAMNNWTHSRRFVLAHECGHHQLGHTTPAGLEARKGIPWASKSQELAADCWAATALSGVMARSDLVAVINKYAAEGNWAPSGYPTGYERAANIVRCANSVYPGIKNQVAVNIAKAADSQAEEDEDSPRSYKPAEEGRTPHGYKRPDWAN